MKVQVKQQEIKKAYQIIKNGGLAIIPSRVGYTLLGNTDKAIKKMFDLKGRPLSKPCVVLTRRDLLGQVARVPKSYLPFVDAIEEAKLLCGFILKRKPHPFFDSLAPFANQYSQRADGTSCFVINASDYIQYLVDQSILDGTFVVGSSANKSGTGNEGIFMNVPENIRKGVDFAIEDDRYVSFGYDPVTRLQGVMIGLTENSPTIVRKGWRQKEVEEALIKTTNFKLTS